MKRDVGETEKDIGEIEMFAGGLERDRVGW